MLFRSLDLASEKQLLDIPTQREECCHVGGSLAFDKDGNLYVAIGDNTNPFDSDSTRRTTSGPGVPRGIRKSPRRT